MEKRKQTQRDVLRSFAVKFLLLCGVLYAVFGWMPDTFFEPVNSYTAAIAGFTLRLLGMEPSVQRVFMSLDGFSVKIITECSAIFVVILFFSFVLAYPASLKKKAIGLLFGIPILFAVNILRLVLVFVTGMKLPGLFEYVHVYFGQVIMIIVVFLACMAWLRTVVMVRTGDTPFLFFVRFIAFSSIPFLAWLYLHKGYVLTQAYIIEFLFRFSGYHLNLSPKLDMLYPNTFNLITFSALVLATQSITRRRRIKGLIMGLSLLSLVHLIFRLYQTLLVTLQVEHGLEILIALKIVNQFFLPFVLWLALVHKDIFSVCPKKSF